MTDVYLSPDDTFGPFFYIGYPKTTGGYGLCRDYEDGFELVDSETLTNIEKVIIENRSKPISVRESLVNQVVFEIQKLENCELTSRSLNEKISLLIKESQTPNEN